MKQVLFVVIGASCGALFRWALGMKYNHIFPSIPMGTLIANLSGSFLMGSIVLLSIEHNIIRRDLLLAVTAGFLSSLTTFSTFSAEVFYLLNKREYWMGAMLACIHLFGSIAMVGIGYYMTKAFMQLGGK